MHNIILVIIAIFALVHSRATRIALVAGILTGILFELLFP